MFSGLSADGGSLITVWLEVRVLPGPPSLASRSKNESIRVALVRLSGFLARLGRRVWGSEPVKDVEHFVGVKYAATFFFFWRAQNADLDQLGDGEIVVGIGTTSMVLRVVDREGRVG